MALAQGNGLIMGNTTWGLIPLTNQKKNDIGDYFKALEPWQVVGNGHRFSVLRFKLLDQTYKKEMEYLNKIDNGKGLWFGDKPRVFCSIDASFDQR